MYVSEANQMKAFIKFVQHKRLTTALRTHDWATFAAGYNGANFADNDYDGKLARAFRHFSAATSRTHP